MALIMAARLTEELVQQIEDWLAHGITQREAGRLSGVSASTVNKIAAGKWRPAPPPAAEDDFPWEFASQHARRCGGCGGLVYRWPCLCCALRGDNPTSVLGTSASEAA